MRGEIVVLESVLGLLAIGQSLVFLLCVVTKIG